MFKIEYDLRCLTCEELIEARDQIQHALEDLAEHGGRKTEYLTDEEKQLIAQALAIDEATGEWFAGA